VASAVRPSRLRAALVLVLLTLTSACGGRHEPPLVSAAAWTAGPAAGPCPSQYSVTVSGRGWVYLPGGAAAAQVQPVRCYATVRQAFADGYELPPSPAP
jgi:hypothetical protein